MEVLEATNKSTTSKILQTLLKNCFRGKSSTISSASAIRKQENSAMLKKTSPKSDLSTITLGGYCLCAWILAWGGKGSRGLT